MVRISTVKGRVLHEPVNMLQQAGSHVLTLPVDVCAAGTYLVELAAGRYRTKTRVALLK